MAETPAPQGRTIGRYELTRLIAVGGMGEIHLARMRGAANFEKQCVIKRILPHLASEEEFVRKFIDEANIVVQLTHGNIVPVFDMGEENGEFFIAMDYIDGTDLRSVLKLRREPMPIAVAAYIVAEVCKGLDYAHKKTDADGGSLDIIHRDISPSNILISSDGAVKIVDFGIAKASSRSTRSITGRLQGKFGYMSPEQARGQELDPRSDIFSTGVVLYEMLTGVRPFDGGADLEVLEKVRTHEPPPPSEHRPEIDEELDAIVLRAIAKSAPDRFESADEMLSALLGFLAGSSAKITAPRVAEALADELSRARDRRAAKGALNLDDALDLEADRLLAGAAAPPTATMNLTPSENGLGAAPTATMPTPSDGQVDATQTRTETAVESTPTPSAPAEGTAEREPREGAAAVDTGQSRLLAVAIILLAASIAAFVWWQSKDGESRGEQSGAVEAARADADTAKADLSAGALDGRAGEPPPPVDYVFVLNEPNATVKRLIPDGAESIEVDGTRPYTERLNHDAMAVYEIAAAGHERCLLTHSDGKFTANGCTVEANGGSLAVTLAPSSASAPLAKNVDTSELPDGNAPDLAADTALSPRSAADTSSSRRRPSESRGVEYTVRVSHLPSPRIRLDGTEVGERFKFKPDRDHLLVVDSHDKINVVPFERTLRRGGELEVEYASLDVRVLHPDGDGDTIADVIKAGGTTIGRKANQVRNVYIPAGKKMVIKASSKASTEALAFSGSESVSFEPGESRVVLLQMVFEGTP